MSRFLSFNANSYLIPVLVSVALHAFIVMVVMWGWESATESKQRVTPRYIEAKLITLTAETEKKPEVVKKKPQVIDLTAKKREQERAAAAAQKKRLAAEKAERERLRALAEKKRLQEQEKERQQAERERREKERLEQEKLAREREQQRQQEQAFSEALAEEEELLQAQQAQATAQSYVAAMAERIEQNWSRPPSARSGMRCELQIQLVPSGDVINVTVIKGSGNIAFDRSAEQAVNKVGRFEVLKDMPIDMFERYFRQVTLVFNPRDLRL